MYKLITFVLLTSCANVVIDETAGSYDGGVDSSSNCDIGIDASYTLTGGPQINVKCCSGVVALQGKKIEITGSQVVLVPGPTTTMLSNSCSLEGFVASSKEAYSNGCVVAHKLTASFADEVTFTGTYDFAPANSQACFQVGDPCLYRSFYFTAKRD